MSESKEALFEVLGILEGRKRSDALSILFAATIAYSKEIGMTNEAIVRIFNEAVEDYDKISLADRPSISIKYRNKE